MVEEKEIPKGAIEAVRLIEQPPDSISFYADYTQILHTQNETILQFYETIPGPPDSAGNIKNVRSLLRATITLSHSHAFNLGKLVVEKTQEVKK